MSQYILWILNNAEYTGYLMKSFKVSPTAPIPVIVDPDCEQIEFTNTTQFNEIITVFKEHGSVVVYEYNEPTTALSCPYTTPPESWELT